MAKQVLDDQEIHARLGQPRTEGVPQLVGAGPPQPGSGEVALDRYLCRVLPQ